jgi:glycosyltransferase involved in cell wall biosynthesis
VQPAAGQPTPPPRVALVTGGLPFGGSTTYLCNLGGELVRRQIPTLVLSLEHDNPLQQDFEKLRIPVTALDDRQAVYEDRVRAAGAALAAFRPTTVVAWIGPIAFELLRHAPPGVGRLGVSHADDPVIYKLLAQYAPWLDAVVGVSAQIPATMSRTPGLEILPAHYIPSGVAIPAQATERQPEQNCPLRILYLGRLEEEQKRVQLFPQIFRELVATGMPFLWTLAGDGPARAALEAALQSPNDRQQVRFLGRVPYTEVPSLLDMHDVYLLASDYEGMPLSLLEAMGHGVVPVVSDLPSGIREIVDETTGRLVDPQDVPGYAAAIRWLHEHRPEWAQLSRTARARVLARHSVAAMTDQWLKLLPATPPVDWPDPITVLAPQGAGAAFRFREPWTTLRRLAKRLQPRGPTA